MVCVLRINTMARSDIFHSLPPLENLLSQADDEEQKRMIQQEWKSYHALQELGDKTHTEARALLGIPYFRARDWRAGHLPPKISYLVKPRGKRNRFIPPRRESVPLAYFMGFCLGNMSPRHSVKNQLTEFTYQGRDEVLHDEIVSSLRKIMGDEAFTIHHRGKRKVLSFFSQDFFTYFSTVTQGYTALPWEHLGTKQQIPAFLKGFFESTLHKDAYTLQDTWHSESLRIKKTKSEQSALLLEDIAIALYHEGIYPNVETRGNYRYCVLKITDPDDIQVLLQWEAIPLKNHETAARLAE